MFANYAVEAESGGGCWQTLPVQVLFVEGEAVIAVVGGRRGGQVRETLVVLDQGGAADVAQVL